MSSWSTTSRAALISAVAIAVGCLFVSAYALALGDPMPRSIDAALVGNGAAHPQIVADVQRVAGSSLIFRDYPSRPAAFHAIDLQHVYATLDLTTPRPALYVASALGASVARVLEQAPAVDPRVRVIDTHPLQRSDPSGLVIFYLTLTATIVGFTTVFQVRTDAMGLSLRRWVVFVCSLGVVGGLVLTLLVGPVLHRIALPVAETWGLLALQLITAAAFASAMALAAGRWALVPTWVLFIVLGNTSSGGAVSPPLLPPMFALISQWLPSGATVTALRDAVYFHAYQHIQPLAVSAAWATGSLGTLVALAHRTGKSPGGPPPERPLASHAIASPVRSGR